MEFFDVDRCHWGESPDDQSKIIVLYLYSRPGINIPQIDDVGNHYFSFVLLE